MFFSEKRVCNVFGDLRVEGNQNYDADYQGGESENDYDN